MSDVWELQRDLLIYMLKSVFLSLKLLLTCQDLSFFGFSFMGNCIAACYFNEIFKLLQGPFNLLKNLFFFIHNLFWSLKNLFWHVIFYWVLQRGNKLLLDSLKVLWCSIILNYCSVIRKAKDSLLYAKDFPVFHYWTISIVFPVDMRSLFRRHPTPTKEMLGPLLRTAAAVGLNLDVTSSKALADSLDRAVVSCFLLDTVSKKI